MKLLAISTIILFLLVSITFASDSNIVHQQTFLCKDYISQSIKKGFPANGFSTAHNMSVYCNKKEIMEKLSEKEKENLKNLTIKFNEEKKKLSLKELDNLEKQEILMNQHWELIVNPSNDITEEDEKYLNDAKKRGASEEDIQNMKCFIKVKREKEKVWTEKEKKELDKFLRSIWNNMREALDKGDIDTAVSYFYKETKDTYRKMFSSSPKKTLSEMSRELSEINMVDVRGNRSAIYEILCTRNGKKYSFQLEFIKNCDDEWKINSY